LNSRRKNAAQFKGDQFMKTLALRSILALGAMSLALAPAVTASAAAKKTHAAKKVHKAKPRAMHTAMANPSVGGAAMAPSKTIVANASAAPNLSTLVAAVKAADLVDTLNSPGPFTVFAPTNTAFDKLPDGTIAAVLQPENKATLTKILTYHVVAGRLTAKDIMAAIQSNGGSASLKTVSGDMLTARISGNSIVITDAKGGQSAVTTGDVMQSNGVVHVIDSVLMP
jgi:uncharacterized surface protein with fasciclin (FAS1) repeats